MPKIRTIYALSGDKTVTKPCPVEDCEYSITSRTHNDAKKMILRHLIYCKKLDNEEDRKTMQEYIKKKPSDEPTGHFLQKYKNPNNHKTVETEEMKHKRIEQNLLQYNLLMSR